MMFLKLFGILFLSTNLYFSTTVYSIENQSKESWNLRCQGKQYFPGGIGRRWLARQMEMQFKENNSSDGNYRETFVYHGLYPTSDEFEGYITDLTRDGDHILFTLISSDSGEKTLAIYDTVTKTLSLDLGNRAPLYRAIPILNCELVPPSPDFKLRG